MMNMHFVEMCSDFLSVDAMKLSGAELKDLCVDMSLLPFSSLDLPCALLHIVR